MEAENASLSASFSNTNSNTKEVSQQDIDMAKRDAKKTVEAMSVELGHKDDQISKLMMEMDAVTQRAVNAEYARSQLEVHENELMGDDESAKKRASQLQTSYDLVVSEKDMCLQKIHELESEIKDTQRTACQTEEQLQSSVEKLSVQVGALQAKEAQMGNLDASQKFMEAKLGDLKAERDEVRTMHQAAVDRIDELEAQLETVTADYVALQAITGDNNAEEQLKSLTTERDVLAERLADQEATLAEVSSKLKRSKDDYQVIKAEWERGELAMQDQETALRAEFQIELEKAQAHVQVEPESEAQVQPAMEEYKVAMMQLSEDFEEKKRECVAIQTQLTETEVQLAALQQQNQLLQLEATTTQESLAELQQQRDNQNVVADLENQVEAAQDEVQHYKQIAVELDDTVRLAQRERLQQETQCGALKADIAHLQVEIASLKASKGSEDEPAPKDTQGLIMELNEIMEEKIELESRLQQAEAECRRCQEQLADYDSKSAKEQASIMQMAQEEIDRLQTEIARLSEQLDQGNGPVVQQSTHSDEEHEELVAAHNDLQQTHKVVVKELEHKVRKSEQAVDKYENKVIALDEKIEKLKGLVVEKDQRIQHLDRNKITREFSDKFRDSLSLNKTLEKEAKKYQKSLESLKSSYDELVKQQMLNTGINIPASTRSAAAASEAAPIAVANADVEAELEKCKKREGQLRDKLRQIVAQMADNDNERADIIDILTNAGIDTSNIGVDLNDLSDGNGNGSSASNKITELTDAIQLLADRLDASKKEVKEQMKYMTKQQAEASSQFYQEKDTLRSKVQALEQEVHAAKASYAKKEAELLADIEERESELRSASSNKTGLAQNFEDKMDNLKNNLKSLREEKLEGEQECEKLRAQCNKLLTELKAVGAELEGEQDRNNTEIKILGEENLELMTEIKGLRKKIMSLEALKGGASASRGSALTLSSSVHAKLESNPAPALGDITSSVASKENVRNIEPDTESRTFKGVASADASKPMDTAAAVSKKVKTKATPLVATNAAEADGESPGECNQS